MKIYFATKALVNQAKTVIIRANTQVRPYSVIRVYILIIMIHVAPIIP